jgi:hypothetical protein
MIAPKRETKPDVNKADKGMGDVNFLFQTPCPLDEYDFLVSWRKSESVKNYQLYYMNVDGGRELLAWADQSVSQPVLIKPLEKTPPRVLVQANYNDSMGLITMQDVYYGEGMRGVARGAAKSIRVVKLHYRVAAGIPGQISGSGPSGAYVTSVTCPVSAYGASWDCKEVLGEAKIYPDGSAAFRVPARVPVYFQVIDTNGFCMATMRSWTTLMPKEKFACYGCHESKIASPAPAGTPQAGTPKPLDTPLGIENKPFDYNQMVQPILDKNCASCHQANHESGFNLTGALISDSSSKRSWTTSYNSLLKGIPVATGNDAITICTIFSPPEQQPPYSFGSYKSGIMTKAGMSGSHHDVHVTQAEKNIIACWIDLAAPYCGKYNSYMSASDSTEYEKLLEKRIKWAAIEHENLKALIAHNAVIPGDNGNGKSFRTSFQKLSIGYVPARHALVLKNFSPGNFLLADLRGKVISRLKISNQRWALVSLPATFSTGIYVARFESGNGIWQTKISMTK